MKLIIPKRHTLKENRTMNTLIIERLKELFNNCEWIETGIYDETEKAFVFLTTDDVGFALQYMEEDFAIQQAEEYANTHSVAEFKNMLKELFQNNHVMGYMLFTVLQLNEWGVIDDNTSLYICRQLTEREEEILQISQKLNNLYS